ncbi:hypothetical protein CO038_04620 [Candidatus Pacearchaeota archaeon CG_4_9_14_0_2_um_filter_39_13]|nr:MAG: hypothetical protein CO038_04620 [Candidatus Pacearchaeota archaeon CG_4_9_14_0_2_um_filter_39_13]
MANRNIFLIIAVIAVVVLLGMVYLPKGNVMLSNQVGSPGLTPISPSLNDVVDECKVFMVDFPKSPVIPTLPPKNNNPYNDPDYLCRHFAFDFCEDVREIPEITECQILAFDTHAINLITYKDDEGQIWVCIVEPQTNEYFCMTFEEWIKLNKEEWIKETVCKEYYKDNPNIAPHCDEAVWSTYLCADISGKACSRAQKGQAMGCVEDAGSEGLFNVGEVECKCNLFGCKWKMPRK